MVKIKSAMNYKILVIDDEQYMHLLTENLLADEFELLSATDAQQAIDILSTQNVHLVLIDV